MSKEHTIKNCWCKNGAEHESEDKKSVMAEMAKDAKREEGMNGYQEAQNNEAPF